MSTSEFTLLNNSAIMDAVTRQHYPAGTLYVVATPIGNIADISLRALHVLSLADAIACEDTRNTAQLLGRYGLNKPLIAAHQHNEREAAEKIRTRLQAGERIALVSDAGTPGISDPGARIVDLLRQSGIPVTPLPGASAAISALSASGLLHDHFYFIGFLPAKNSQRETALQGLTHIPATLIFYEAPHRITDTLKTMAEVFGNSRTVVLAREISKLFEEIHRCPLQEALTWVQADAHREKGEYVILVDAAPELAEDDTEARRVLGILLEACSVKQAAALAAQLTGMKKNTLYQLALSMREEKEED